MLRSGAEPGRKRHIAAVLHPTPHCPVPVRLLRVGIAIDHFLLPSDRLAPGAMAALLSYIECWRIIFWPRTPGDAPADEAMILQGRVFRQVRLWFEDERLGYPDPRRAYVRLMEFLEFERGPVPVALVIEPEGEEWPAADEVRARMEG